ncbi:MULTISPECIES: DUF6138 family protein [Paenibacillus]|uniref:DUF6138 family protein n=1 Tax=Paenibacillus TaxID=44249 RepID=UPI000414B938|nr:MULTISPECIES: DUF6138 family protein [Paenibacillus]KGP81287.1 hypothetical protein P364_0117350 [Paenibacillus sp. MAEPY2]KGP87552.1 hypothetical protein P363_0110825 [Paenibacillus sp. MAEPY1]OZQ72051.1 hypothetical protein CA599_07905 [Paenibacillus taichungensis]HBU84839.1 hypothetical protein [Paenibacillus sp.]
MSTLYDQAMEEMIAVIHEWFEEQMKRNDLEKAVKRTTLQMGIFNDILLDYRPGRTTVDSVDLGLDEGFKSKKTGPFTEEQVRNEIQPKLVEVVQEKLDKLVDTALIDYRFTFRGKFPTTEGKLQVTMLEYNNEGKRQQLLERIHTYVDQKLLKGSYPTKPLESFFLTRHLLDPKLFPELNVAWTIAQYDRIQELNKGRQEALAEHRGDIIRAITSWAENYFLPQYFDVQPSAYSANVYTLKPGASLEEDEAQSEHEKHVAQPIDLLLYAAVMILRYEPSYSKPKGLTFLELAKQLGSSRAVRMMTEGSGTYAKEDIHVKNELVEFTANDVFSMITIHIRKEEAAAYEQAIAFIIRLLKQGFPKSYKIKLKSSVKQYLPIKGLAKSDTHRFFANALSYPELLPLLEEYAREAIEEFEFYEDTEGEKSCMPGSYATFGLGLTDERYFPLVEYYMGQVDDEHQLVQDKFTVAFTETHGVTVSSIPALVACLRRSTDYLKLKIQPELENEEKLEPLVNQLQKLESYEVERALYPIWGKVEKLATLARKADGRRKELLLELLKAAGK